MTPVGVGWVGGRAGIIQAIPDGQREQTNRQSPCVLRVEFLSDNVFGSRGGLGGGKQ